MASLIDRRVFCKTSATSLMALGGELSATGTAARPFLSEPYSVQPGEPVFLLEGSTLEDLWAVRRRVNPLVKSSRSPVMVMDREWEGNGPYLYGSVLYDSAEKLFKMWYTVSHDFEYRKHLPGSYLACYATSPDGYTWHKPELNVFEWKGSKRNNFIAIGRVRVGSITVLEAPPDAGVSSKYIAVYLDGPSRWSRPNATPGVCLAYSNNGVEWTESPQNPIEPSESDTHNSIVYDARAHKWMVHLRPPVYAGFTKRRAALMESRDLQTWTRPETVLLPDEADVPEFYAMPVFQRGNLYFGHLHVYDRPTGRIEVELVFSSDGRHWNRVPPRELYLTRGAPGEFDQGMVFTASAPVIAHGEMRVYYGGIRTNHNQEGAPGGSSIGLASIPLDRFFAMTSSSHDEPGFIVTRPMILNGSDLEVNAKMLPVQGQIKVAVLDLGGQELPGFGLNDCHPIKGYDSLRHQVSWGKGQRIANLPKQPLRLKFQLDEATFYAFYTK